MSAIDRVMRAYASKHDLKPTQAALVRDELAKFIDELMTGSRRAPMMFPETVRGSDNGSAQQRMPEAVVGIGEGR